MSSVNLSSRGLFDSLAVVNRKLIVSGGPQGSLVPSASIWISSMGSRKTCNSVVVNPSTLMLGAVRHDDCFDPSLYGVRVLPASGYVLHTNSGAVS